MKPTKFTVITVPLPKKQRGDVGDDAADADDVREEFDVVENGDASSECVVDTDVDSAAANSDDNGGSEDSDDDGEGGKLIKPPLPVTVEAQIESSGSEVAKAKATRLCSGREERGRQWSNDYFYIPEASRGLKGIRIRMRKPVSKAMGGMGADLQAKHLTPCHYGETMERCPVTTLLLRVWMLWRTGRDGWAFAKECRQRQFDEARQTLQRDIRKIQDQHGGSLGTSNADAFLNKWLNWQDFQIE